MVQDAIKSTLGLTELREKITQVVTITRQSSSAKDRFETCQKTAGYPTIRKLHQNVPHRWNSLYDMLQRFLELKLAVALFLVDDTSVQFTSDNWAAIKAIVHILRPLFDVTTELCSEKHTSISKVIPLTKILKSFYTAECEKDQDDIVAQELSSKLLSKLKTRFEHVEASHILALATILDPRYKTKGFEKHEKIARSIQILKDEALFESKRGSEGESEGGSQIVEPPLKQIKKVNFVF